MKTNVQQRFEGGGCKVEVGDVLLTLSTSFGGALRVSWASDWERLHELRAAGLLRRAFDRHTWGHQEFFADGALLAAVAN